MPENLDSFRKLRLELEVETMEDLERLLEEGELSFDHSLGVLLEILRMDSNDVIRTGAEYFDDHKFEPWVEKMRDQYGCNPDSPASYFQGERLNVETLTNFVERWQQNEGERRWNPSWAPIEINPQMVLYCKDHSPGEVLTEFGLEEQALLYPCDGFTLAECLRLSYERET
tara:strand:+ start:68 stop:580 length:513 start_codon:yes stop_codon:yes gene_type:complete